MITNVRIALTDDERRILATSLGKPGLATRDDVRRIAKQAVQKRMAAPRTSTATDDTVAVDTQTALRVASTLLKDLSKLQRASGIPGDVLSAIQTAVNSSLPNFIKALESAGSRK